MPRTCAACCRRFAVPSSSSGTPTGGAIISNAPTGLANVKALVYIAAFAADLPLQVTSVVQSSQRPFSLAAFTEPSGDPAWTTIPSWYLVATADRAIPPDAQRFMAARAGSTVVEVRSSHAALISHPGATVALITRAVRSIS